MKHIIVILTSALGFRLNAIKLYNPDKYRLHLITDIGAEKSLQEEQQNDYFDSITVIEEASYDVVEKIVHNILISRCDFDIVSNGEDVVDICGKLRVKFGLDSRDYRRFVDKNHMKSLLSMSDIFAIPKYLIFNNEAYLNNKEAYLDELEKKLRFPLFIKPTQQLSCVGAKKITDRKTFMSWYDYDYIDDESYEIDEFINGTMYHCDSFIKNGEILFSLISQNSRPCYDFMIGKAKGTIVIPEDSVNYKILNDANNEILYQLGLPKAGVTHLEMFVTEQSKLYFVEVAYRSPGCLIPRMYQTQFDIDIYHAHLLLQIDPDYYPVKQKNRYAAWACFPKTPGTVRQLKSLDALIESTYDLQWFTSPGEVFETYPANGRDYCGTLFMINDSFDKLFRDFLWIHEQELCVIN